jgi:hypothetical protein
VIPYRINARAIYDNLARRFLIAVVLQYDRLQYTVGILIAIRIVILLSGSSLTAIDRAHGLIPWSYARYFNVASQDSIIDLGLCELGNTAFTIKAIKYRTIAHSKWVVSGKLCKLKEFSIYFFTVCTFENNLSAYNTLFQSFFQYVISASKILIYCRFVIAQPRRTGHETILSL